MSYRTIAAMFILLCCQAAGLSGSGTSAGKILPGTGYDTAVPTLAGVVGFDWGENITTHAECEKYLKALAEASPRAALFSHGKSWEGRALYYLVIGSRERLEDLDRLKAGLRELAFPLSLDARRREELTGSLPVVVWIAANIHGNEPSGGDAGLFLAYHLLAAQQDTLVERIFRECLVVIDPVQNPDGRDFFVNYFRRTTGSKPASDPAAAERRAPWPGGRTNHYLFDMNRDWYVQTQPESRGRVKAYLEWYPHVFVDLHEMGSDATYYFPPVAPPVNPYYSEQQVRWNEEFGRNNACWFDRFGFKYWTGELFDAFFPGYGCTWPSLSGSVGLTYEQASSRGLVARREDETEMSYLETVRHHAVAAFATAELASASREALLRDFVATRTPPSTVPANKAYLIPVADRPCTSLKLVRLLLDNGIEVRKAGQGFACSGVAAADNRRISRQEFPAGTYVVPARQEACRLAANLLETRVEMDRSYVEEQERRLAAGLPHQVYDVTAWCLPLSFGVECYRTDNLPGGEYPRVSREDLAPGPSAARSPAGLAYLLDGRGNGCMAALAELFGRGVRVYSSDKAFTLDGAAFGRGSLIVPVKENGGDLPQIIAGIENSRGVSFYPAASGWTTEGVNFGSENVHYLPAPGVLLIWDTPTHSYSAGACRYVLEQQYGVRVTAVRAGDLERVKLERYNVLVFPQGWDYPEALGKQGMEKIKRWVAEGGTLVAIGSACDLTAHPGLELLELKKEYRLDGDSTFKQQKAESGKKEEVSRVPATAIGSRERFLDYITSEAVPPRSVPGVLLRIRLDPDHWLSAGYDSLAVAFAVGGNVYAPLKRSQGRNVAYFAEESRLLISGYAWRGAALTQLAFKPYLVHRAVGEGH
ncbi:MAG: peptidase M14, partial [Candidatus Glassbacteria bacterium]|nr:peptidase M14 [Candidatus Glassbacteria bacterium]